MPDGISSALSSVANSGALKDATALAGIGSTAYNLYNQYQNQQYQNKLRSYAQDPQKLNQYAAQFTQPLNAGLTTGVANQAQAYLAQRGLSDSPQISEQVEAQAISPYIQQNQQQGYQNALQALNLGGGAVNPNLQSTNTIAGLAKAFSQLPGLGGGNGQAALSQLIQMASAGPTPETTSPALNTDSLHIPYQPTQTYDPSAGATYIPDYVAALAGGGYTSE